MKAPRLFHFSPARAVALALALLASPALLVNQANAVTYTWNGTASNFWNNAGNWDVGATPVAANTTDVIIAGTTNLTSLLPDRRGR